MEKPEQFDPTKQPLRRLPSSARLACARSAAGSVMPYIAAGLAFMSAHSREGFGSVALTEGGVLVYDPDALGDMLPLEAGAVLIACYLHQFMNHAERFRVLVKRGTLAQSDREVWNIAATAAVSDDIEAVGLPLPMLNGSVPITPKRLRLPSNKTAEQYVALLKQRQNEQEQGEQRQNEQGEQEQGEQEQNEQETGPGWSQMGSVAGNPIEDEPDAKTSLAEQQAQRLSTAVKANACGNVPLGLALQAKVMADPTHVDWESAISAYVSNAVAINQAGVGEWSNTVQHRWQSSFELEYGDLAPRLTGEAETIIKIAVVVDTSGSMSMDLPRALKAVKEIMDVTDGDITFGAMDCIGPDLIETHSIDEVLDRIEGGGGTSFIPAFETLATYDPEHKPTLLIFITDGLGPAPAKEPDIPTLWVITPQGTKPTKGYGRGPIDWGHFIWMPDV